MTDLRSAKISFNFFISERERERERELERKREKYLEGGSEGAPSTGAEVERSAISNLQSAISDLRSAI